MTTTPRTFTAHDLATRISDLREVEGTFAAEAVETYLAQVEEIDGREIDRDEITEDDANFIIAAFASAQRAGDFGTRELDTLAYAASSVEDADRALRDAQATRDRAIRHALARGARVVDVMAAAGVSRARIDQIRKDNR